MSHNTLQNYYTLVHRMVQQQFATITEIENMIPFELEVYMNIGSAEAQRQQDQMKIQESLARNQ